MEQTTSNPRMDIMAHVDVQLQVLLGDTTLSVTELLALKEGDTLPLRQKTNQPLAVLLNNQCVAYGKIVMVDDQYALQITQLINQQEHT